GKFLLGPVRLLQFPVGEAEEQVRLVVAILGLKRFPQVSCRALPLVMIEKDFSQPEVRVRRRRPPRDGGRKPTLRFLVVSPSNERLNLRKGLVFGRGRCRSG